MSRRFYSRSIKHVLGNARKLQDSFPGLQLSVAQESIARAFGFSGLFDCRSRLEAGNYDLSPPDEDISPDEYAARLYQQITAIVDHAKLPPYEVEGFVRTAKMTANTPGRPFLTDYARLNRMLDQYDGMLTDARLRELFPAHKTPVLTRIAEGVILASMEDGDYYHWLSVSRLQGMPPYMRGNRAAFRQFYSVLGAALPDVIRGETPRWASRWMSAHEGWLYEWYTGTPSPNSRVVALEDLARQGERDPSARFAVSLRWDNTKTYSKGETPSEIYVPTLRGDDYARFLRSKGELRFSDVAWFRLKKSETGVRVAELLFEVPTQLPGATARPQPTARLEEGEIEPAAPLYGSPFKHGPMNEIEFRIDMEGTAPPLASDWDAGERGLGGPKVGDRREVRQSA